MSLRLAVLHSSDLCKLLRPLTLCRYLEERTAVTIEKATSRLQDGDRRLKISDDKILDLERALLESQVSDPLLSVLLYEQCKGK
jgi:hypothetical protein